MKFDTQDIISITNNEYCRTHKTIFTLQLNTFYLLSVIRKCRQIKRGSWLAAILPQKLKKGIIWTAILIPFKCTHQNCRSYNGCSQSYR